MPAREATKVLVIDDSEISCELAAMALEDAGFEVRASTTIDDVDATLGSWRPDLILTDVKMPGVSGVELCRSLKSRYQGASVRVVLFSALSSAELEVLARECNADAYLSKTAGFDRLGEALTALVASSPT
jgi:DNA-binding response OmpR family regulator